MSRDTEITYELIAKVLFENYESIYDIDIETSAYKTYYQSEFYQEFKLAKSGEDFFKDLPAGINRVIAPDDIEYVSKMLARDALLEGVRKEKYYAIVYRIKSDDKLIYHQLRATLQPIGGGPHILMGIRNIDEVIRLEMARSREIEGLEEELRMSRIRNSRSQMQPHFLYNALGSIQEVMLSDPEYAAQLLGDFTVHLRGCVRAMASDSPVPFSQELANIKAYVNIEKMRFGDKLSVKYDIGADDFLICPLSIQPLVENSIRHGIYERGKAGGEVVIKTQDAGDAHVIEVADDGVGFDADALFEEVRLGKRDSTGLSNIMFRLSKVLGADVEIKSTPGVGTVVRVTVPKRGGQDASNSCG